MCLIASDARAPRLAFSFALWLWTLAGSDDLAWISYYNSRGGAFSDDGVHLNGAFGHRLRAAAPLDQLNAVIEQLRIDPASRRAVAHISSPVDALNRSRDRPCAVALQFLLRESRLQALTFMRSQSAAMVLPYDAFLFMCLQCWMAARLGVEPGCYHHVAGSFHVYEEELEFAQRIIDADMEAHAILPFQDPERDFEDVFQWESTLRDAVASGNAGLIRADADRYAPPRHFSEQLRCALLADAGARLGDTKFATELAAATSTSESPRAHISR
jgi:hypothetical protein